jgi:hypothetical protein
MRMEARAPTPTLAAWPAKVIELLLTNRSVLIYTFDRIYRIPRIFINPTQHLIQREALS